MERGSKTNISKGSYVSLTGPSRTRKSSSGLRTTIGPKFYKIMSSPIIQNQRLRIPKKFMKKYGKEIETKVNIKLKDGKSYIVKVLRKKGGEVYLTKGWDYIVESYSVSYGFMFLFSYKGNSNFHLRIYDLSYSEIEYELVYNQKRAHEELISILEDGGDGDNDVAHAVKVVNIDDDDVGDDGNDRGGRGGERKSHYHGGQHGKGKKVVKDENSNEEDDEDDKDEDSDDDSSGYDDSEDDDYKGESEELDDEDDEDDEADETDDSIEFKEERKGPRRPRGKPSTTHVTPSAGGKGKRRADDNTSFPSQKRMKFSGATVEPSPSSEGPQRFTLTYVDKPSHAPADRPINIGGMEKTKRPYI